MDHFFTLSNFKDSSCIFLPMDSVLKEEGDPPAANSVPVHPYNTSSEDKHDVRNNEPEVAIQQLSQKEGKSENQSFAELFKQQEIWDLKKQQQEAAKRMESQHKLSGKDFDVHKIDIEEQKRLYKEAQHASKQSQFKSNSTFYSTAHQYEERQDQQPVQGSNVDFVSHFGARQQQLYGPQVIQQQSQPLSYHHQNTSHQLHAQFPYPQPDTVARKAHLPRAGVAENFCHNPPNNSIIKGYGSYQQMQHQYEPVSRLNQPYSQQQQHPNLSSSQINPYNLEVGSMILYDNSPARSGIIKWIGYLPESNTLSAGIEMDDYVNKSTDGVWNGCKYFTTQPGKGCFVPIADLRPNRRFDGGSSNAVISPSSTAAFQGLPDFSASNKADEATTQSYHDLTNLEDQVKELQINHNSHDNQLIAFNTTVDKHKTDIQKSTERIEVLEKTLVVIQTSLKNEIQQQLSDLQKINIDLQTQLSNTQQQLSDVHKNNEMLQINNMDLKNRLSLTQQQLLGIQSMITCSRLWVVSHDQFTIGKEIGRGAWATVHEATFRGATVAAKCLHQIITAPRTKQLFQREMEMALQCQHQNIVTFLGATLEGPPVILMELMDTNLRSAYEQGRIRDHQVLGILYDIVNALHFLHTRPDPVIHRDVSSANVLLKAQYNGEWLAKVGDLGTAKIQQQAATAGPGAIAYGAPEAGDFTKHSPKMDVYSYGVLVLEILTKTHPFQIVDDLKVQVQQQFPQYHQLVTSCTNQQSNDRPTMYDVIGQLDMINTP